jgi:phosphatidylserine/phosphatidylglycerophosphate/cardiolipin synthase-like enzyme
MALPREIADLYERLSAAREGLFGRQAAHELGERGDVQGVASRMPIGAVPALVTCLQSLAILEEKLEPRLVQTEFVATLPATVTVAARDTASVVREMLDGAAREVIALGYEMGEEGFIEGLARAARRVSVTLIWDRERAVANNPLAGWPPDAPAPTVFQDRARDDAAPYAKMHGKALLVDGTDLLISSANFTFHGLHGNLEFGVRLRGRSVERAGDVLKAMLSSELLERVEGLGQVAG